MGCAWDCPRAMQYSQDQQKCVQLAEEIINQIGKKVEIRVDKSRLRPEKSEVQRLLADNTLAKERLNWAPSINLREGISRTIRWVEANQDLYQENHYQI